MIHWRHVFLLTGIIGVAACLRLWQIDSIPPGFHLDESFEGLEAWRILADPEYRPIFLTGNFGVPPLNAYANAASFGVAGLFGVAPGPTTMRVTAAVFGLLGVIALFALGDELRRLDTRRLTLAFPYLAAAMLATMRWHIHFSRMGIEPVLVPLLWAASLWLFLRGWRTGAWLWFAACGVLLAACLYTYQGAWIIPLLMAPITGILWWSGRNSVRETAGRQRLRGAIVAATVSLLLVLPLAWFFVGNQELLLLRPTQIVVTANGSSPATPFDNLLASARMFLPMGGSGDLDPRRNLPGAAALNWWQALPFLLGVGIALSRIGNPAHSILLLGLAGLLLPGIFSEYAPHFHRILGAAAPAALLGGMGLDTLARWIDARVGSRGGHLRWGYVVSVAVLAGGAVVGARTYFVRWAALPDLYYAFDVGLWQIGQDIAAAPPERPIFLTPRQATHPTLAFAWTTRPDSHAAPISFDGRHLFPLTQGTTTAETYIVIEAEDFRSRLLLPEVLPGAVIVNTLRDRVGETYARYFERPAGEPADRPPQNRLDTSLGDGIRLGGYDVEPADLEPGGVLYLQLHWLVDVSPTGDWTVFTHLLGDDGEGGLALVAGHDSRPGNGSLPTNKWQAGWRVLDEYQLALPADLAPGSYLLEVGLYRDDGSRLPTGETGILLGEVQID